MKLKANWIWDRKSDGAAYNSAILACRRFEMPSIKSATMCITADSWYRLFINGSWICDGPCRSWPEHYQYDVLDVTPYLAEGENEIGVLCRHFGCGTFHQVPRQGGLLVQLDAVQTSGKAFTLVTDRQWQTSSYPALCSNTPKISIQMEPFEQYDARREGELSFSPARVLCAAGKGPWGGLNPRDVALLTRQPFALKRFVAAREVASDWNSVTFLVGNALYPGFVDANIHVSMACAVATVIRTTKARRIAIESPNLNIRVNGRGARPDGTYQLAKGPNVLFASVRHFFVHEREKGLRFVNAGGFTLENPLDPTQQNPWCLVAPAEWRLREDDLFWGSNPHREAYAARVGNALEEMAQRATDPAALRREAAGAAFTPSADGFLADDPHWQFLARRELRDAARLVRNPGALLYNNCEATQVSPPPRGDAELLYDFGEQNCGYLELDITAPEGTVVDMFLVEEVWKDKGIQHTWGNRNGVRYICHGGRNHFFSTKRRSGRYLYATLRGLTGPASIRHMRMIESTYPVSNAGSFACSDDGLTRTWEISARTLRLCMEDTFTDCPLYEQTLWVGDARNEALFAYTAFGAGDIARRFIVLAGQSLERYPLVGCQVPSAWDCMLPAWSFLWGIGAWEHYHYTGDLPFLRRTWPWIMANLRNAAEFCNDRGLFSAPFWNLFDWAAIDQGHETVVHNSLFMIGAIDAAIKCANALKAPAADARWLDRQRAALVKAVNALWDAKKASYPDSIHADGTVSPNVSQHTSFLSLLYDVAEPSMRRHAIRNITEPPAGMTRVGSPFAAMFLFEALEKCGLYEEILRQIRVNYAPMLESGATTVWETFPNNDYIQQFPTRSHCHAWSSAPIHFLNRIVLGIEPAAPGGTRFTISPRPLGLAWARGATVSAQGPVSVEWRIEDGKMVVLAEAPNGTELAFVKNAAMRGLKVMFNGRKV